MGWPVQASLSFESPNGELVRRAGQATTLFQKGAIICDGSQETMVVRFLYTGQGDLFGCVGTVPLSSWIKPTGPDVLDELDYRSGLPSFEMFSREADSSRLSARHQDLYNFELHRSLDEMQSWKERNGFRSVTEKEHEIFEYYLSRNNMFLTSLVPYGYRYEAESDRETNVWTRPVQVTFESDRIRYPLLASTVEDGTHTYISLDLLIADGWPGYLPEGFSVEYEGDFELGFRRYNVTRLEARLPFEDIREDLEIELGAHPL